VSPEARVGGVGVRATIVDEDLDDAAAAASALATTEPPQSRPVAVAMTRMRRRTFITISS
jgi:hypothetical protein